MSVVDRSRLVTAVVAVIVLVPAVVSAGDPPPPPPSGGNIDAEATVTSTPQPTLPEARCWWESKSASGSDQAGERRFWNQIDGGDHSEDVTIFFEDGHLHRSFTSTQTTYVLQVRVCNREGMEGAGNERWTVTGPPNPTVLWDELTERVVRRVPLPDPTIGFEAGPDGVARIAVNVGLWVAVENADDVVARAEPAPGVWAETRATLDRIEFDSGTGVTVTEGCSGAGTPLAESSLDTTDEGGCGYTYTTVDELGSHTAVVRAIWRVDNTTSNGDTERRPDIVLETPIPVEVYEIQTVGTG